MKHILRFLFLFSLFLFCSSSSSEEIEKKPEPKKGAQTKLVFSSIEGYANALVSENILKEAYRRLGIDVEFKQYPAKKALDMSNSGKVDGEAHRIDGVSERFKNLIQVSVPIDYMEAVVLSKQKIELKKGWHSLNGYRIGIVKGIQFSELGTKGLTTINAETSAELTELLKTDKIDIAITTRLNGLIEIEGNGLKNIKDRGTLETYLLYHYLNRKNKHLLPKINRVLKEMLLEGTVRKIRKKTVDDLHKKKEK